MRAVARNRSQRASRHLWAETGSCQNCPNGHARTKRAISVSPVVPSGPAPTHPHTACSWQRGEKETAVKHSSTASQTFPTTARQHMYFKFHSDSGHMPSPIKEPTEAHLSIVGQRWPLEARPTSPASLLDRFSFYDAGGEPMSSRWSSWPACAGMTSVGSASCSRCP